MFYLMADSYIYRVPKYQMIFDMLKNSNKDCMIFQGFFNSDLFLDVWRDQWTRQQDS